MTTDAMTTDAMTTAARTRHASVIRLKPEAEEEYRRIHAAVWPDVLRQIRDSHIRNYSIFLRDGLLFSYYEYAGTDHVGDLAAMAADPRTREWWAPADEVFHTD